MDLKPVCVEFNLSTRRAELYLRKGIIPPENSSDPDVDWITLLYLIGQKVTEKI